MPYRILPFSIAASTAVGIFETLGISPQAGTLDFTVVHPNGSDYTSYPVTLRVSASVVDSVTATTNLGPTALYESESNGPIGSVVVPDASEVYVLNTTEVENQNNGVSSPAVVSGYAVFTPAASSNITVTLDGPTGSSTTYTY